MEKIQLLDLNSQYKRIEKNVRARMDKVLAHGQYIMGPEIAELEEQLAAFAGVKYAISCSNGTDALLMGLMAYGIGPGDAVFTTGFTFIATAEVITLLGAAPVFVDIDPKTKNLDPVKLKAAIERVLKQGKLKPKGIIPVDLFGLPADYKKIQAVAKTHQLFILEDAAQSLGAMYEGKRTCGLGFMAATSFFPAKPLGCYGDGGAIFTDDTEMAAQLKSIRVHGQGQHKYENIRLGINGRLDTLQAAILLAKLEIFQDELNARQNIAEVYTKGLSGMVTVPHIPSNSKSAWAQYSIECPSRDGVRADLSEKGIPTAVYYPIPLHLQQAFSFLGHSKGDLPVTEHVAESILSLPCHPYLQKEQIDFIIQSVRDVVKS